MPATQPPAADLEAPLAAITDRAFDVAGSRGVLEVAAAMAAVTLSRGPHPFMDAARREAILQAVADASTLSADALRAAATGAMDWKTRRSPMTLTLTQSTPPSAAHGAYSAVFADAVSFAASLEPVDLTAINTAAMIAATQSIPAAHAAPPPRPVSSPPWPGPAPGAPPATAASCLAAAAVAEDPATAGASASPSLAELYAELDALIGLDTVKSQVKEQAELARMLALRSDAGLRSPDVTRHLVFTGNPGTGKTTVARLVARIYAALGILPSGQLVEVDKAGLVGGYLGQTESKTADVIARAQGGLLFIDEAYALADDQYGAAAVEVLIKAAEDSRDTLVVVLAGYTVPMEKFLVTNPGLRSRFHTVIEFADYSTDELVAIFTTMVRASDYTVDDVAIAAFARRAAGAARGPQFGNARFARNCFEEAILAHAWRLRDIPAPTAIQFAELIAADVFDRTVDSLELAVPQADPTREAARP